MFRPPMAAQVGPLILLSSIFIQFSVPAFALDNKPEQKKSIVESGHRFPTHMTLEEAAEYENLVPEKAVFSKALGTEETFTPGSSVLQSALVGPSGLFNGIFAGNTTYDYQHRGTCHRQIQTGIAREGPLSGRRLVHISWMKLDVYYIGHGYERSVHYNCYNWAIPGWIFNYDPYGGMAIVEQGNGGGYTHIDVNKNGKAAAFHHCFAGVFSPYPKCVRFAIPGLDTYVSERLVSLSGQSNLWPSGDISDDTTNVPIVHHWEQVIHVVAHGYEASYGGPAVQAYWRYGYQDTVNKYVWEGPVPMDSAITLSHLVLAQGTRVVIAFGKPRNYGSGSNDYNNDLAYYESNLAGADWIAAGGPVTSWETSGGWNVTDYRDSDMHRFYIDITGGFDSEGRLHLAYTNPAYDETAATVSIGPCELLHWSETVPGANAPAVASPGPDAGFISANFQTVTRAIWGTDGTPGNVGSSGRWNRYISKICLAFGDGSTDCDGEPNLDYLYMTYCQDGSPDPLDKADASAAGMQNSNVWLSISRDKGLFWAAPECITATDGSVGGTPTRTPGCDPETGDTCLSEDWQSNAEIVNDTLHVFYVGDLDAGGVVQGEGSWQVNDLMYLPVFGGTDGDLCPVLAPVLKASITRDPHCEYYSDLDESINTETMEIDNFGNATLTYSVTLGYESGSGWLSFVGYGEEIDETTIPKGGATDEYTVEMDGSALANGLYLADIEVTHDDPTKGDSYIIPIQLFRADSFICSETVTMTTPCIVLDVTNTERWGVSHTNGMRYYVELDDDSLFNPFYDGSLAIANRTRTASGPDTIVYRNIFANPTLSNPGFRALEHPKMYYDAASNDSVVAANQVTVDSTIGISVRYLFPQEPENCQFVRIMFSIYPLDDQTQDLVIGAAADVDCPGSDADGLGSENFGGCIPYYNLIYQQGTDTTRDGDFRRVTNRFVAGMSALTCKPIKRWRVGDSPLNVYPDGGFYDGYIFTQMNMNGCEVWADSAEDLHVIMAFNEITLAPGDVEIYQMALVSSIAGGTGVELANMPADVSDLIATTARAWKKGFGWCGDFWMTGGALQFEYTDGHIDFAATGTHEGGTYGGCCGCEFSYEIIPEPSEGTITMIRNYDCTGRLDFQGIAEGQYTVTLNVEDLCFTQYDQVVFMIDVAGCDCGAVWGDVNGDGKINPLDIVYMINYVYRDNDQRIHPPNCHFEAGDVNCDERVDPVDAVHYVNYVYKNITPWPCEDPCTQ